MAKKVAVIGGGYAGLSGAAMLAKEGFDVTLYDKHDMLGGRGQKLEKNGFTFDMGPSWYWMPEVFEEFYQLFGHTTSDFYTLDRLDPSYRVYFGKDDFLDVPADPDAFLDLVEKLEPGGSLKLQKYLKEAEYKYKMGMQEFVRRPGLSILEFADPRLIPAVFKLHLFRSITDHIKKYFKNPRLRQILEFPVIFLGAKPAETPALYSLMNHADINLGTWYPQGGMFKVIEAFEKIGMEAGVKFELNSNVEAINIKNGKAVGLTVNGKEIKADVILGSADYHHIDQHLLPEKYRSYTPEYWDSRKLSPSCLIYYIGLNTKLKEMPHHTLFFDKDMDEHMAEIYDYPKWPSDPLLYTACPSISDKSIAPEGKECLFILIPVAVDLKDSPEIRAHYLELALNRIEKLTDQSITDHIEVSESYAYSDYVKEHNALKGNAFGLANTLKQTAILKPKMRSGKVKNLFFAGQLTSPGPGVPPSIISGQVSAGLIKDYLNSLDRK
ncbi:MAG: phytoene desaturase [Granulosicoccus sp.]